MAKKNLLGIFAIGLIFCMAFTGCDNGLPDDGDGNDGLPEGLQTSYPSASVLSSFSLPEGIMAAINTAAGGGYQGWIIEDRLELYWTGRNEAQCDAVIAVIRSLLPFIEDSHGPETHILSGDEGTGTIRVASGSYVSGGRYSVAFAVTAVSVQDLSMPQGFLIVHFWEDDYNGGVQVYNQDGTTYTGNVTGTIWYAPDFMVTDRGVNAVAGTINIIDGKLSNFSLPESVNDNLLHSGFLGGPGSAKTGVLIITLSSGKTLRLLSGNNKVGFYFYSKGAKDNVKVDESFEGDFSVTIGWNYIVLVLPTNGSGISNSKVTNFNEYNWTIFAQ